MIRYTIAVSIIALLSAAGAAFAANSSEVADAAQQGDLQALNRLLGQNSDVNLPQVDGSTAMHWAVYRGDLAMTDLLIQGGADVTAATREGITPLYLASVYGPPAVIEKLLAAGADATARGPHGETMLMRAARNGNPEGIRLLIAAGADVNASEPARGTTALMWAAEQKHPAAVAALLDAGADPGARSAPAGIARGRVDRPVNVSEVRRAQQLMLAQLRGEADGDSDSPSAQDAGQTAPPAPAASPQAGAPAEPAAAGGAAAPEEDDGPVAGLVGAEGGMLTALIFAARENDLESAKILISAGADVNQVTNYRWSPLLTATQNRNYQLARFLIENGADVNIANNGGWTPLYLATDNRNIEGGDYPWPKADMDHLDFIKLLLDHGADVNARIRDNTLTRTIFTQQWFHERGATAFVRASQSADIELMRLLLSHGADPNIPTEFGDTALSVAAGIGWVEGVTHEWSREDNLEAVKLLLDLGLDPNTANQDGRTPLMGAALKGRDEVVQLLVDTGARLETRDYGSRDTDRGGASILAGHTWQAIDYAEGLVRVGVQSATTYPETAALIRQLMVDRGLPVPDPNRTLDSICIVVLCMGEPLPD